MLQREKVTERKSERGSILAVTAFGMLSFLLAVGLCVDISHFYVVKAELQNAADASALAGASALNSAPGGITEATTRAVQVMNYYEFNNEGVTINPENVKFAANFGGPYVDAASAQAQAGNIRFVQVEIPPKQVSVFFATPVLNTNTVNLSQEAIAGMSVPPNVFCEWIPLAVIDDEANPMMPGNTYVIRGGSHGSVSPGNRQILAVNGSGASVVRFNLAKGVNEWAIAQPRSRRRPEPPHRAHPDDQAERVRQRSRHRHLLQIRRLLPAKEGRGRRQRRHHCRVHRRAHHVRRRRLQSERRPRQPAARAARALQVKGRRQDMLRRIKIWPTDCRRFARCERGTQLVELAIVLPVLLALFGATAEFGRYFYTYTTLDKATRVGARYLTVAPPGATDEQAQNLVVYGNTSGTGEPIVSGLTPDQIEITRNGGGASSLPQLVTVQIQGYTYEPLFDIGLIIGRSSVSLNIDVSPSTTMRSYSTIPS
ncbi:MAG: pilus assembly protein [Acidobacteria bacterium]|nr:pilus assembly protein [Acidobacteriota bacterium]